MNFPSVRGGQGLSKGRRGLGERGGGGWRSGTRELGPGEGLRAWGLGPGEGQGAGVRGGAGPSGDQPDGRSLVRSFVRSFARSFGRTDGKFTPLCYRTSSPSGPLPKKEARDKICTEITEIHKSYMMITLSKNKDIGSLDELCCQICELVLLSRSGPALPSSLYI